MNYTRQPSAYMLESTHSICYNLELIGMHDNLLDWFKNRDEWEPCEIQTVQTHHPDAMPQCVAESIHHAAVSKKLSNPLVFPNKSTYRIRRADNCPF